MGRAWLVGVLSAGVVLTAQAGFSLHGGAVVQESGVMGDRTHAERRAEGRFQHSSASLEPRQKRFDDAELMIDLAYRAMTQRGTGNAHSVDGFADNVPFAMGMQMLLPDGWQLYREKGLVPRKVPETISFLGGKPWPHVLEQIGDRYALQFHVDWYDRVVMMREGRPGALAKLDRIKIIEEPAPSEPVALAQSALQDADEAAPAVVTALGDDAPIKSSASLAAGDSASTQMPVADAAPVEAVSAVEPIAPPAPVVTEHAMLVLKGTLFENVQRLSELNGWNPPQWDIQADFRVHADYTITAKSFEEAMAKLLLLHPLQADVNVNQRKIYVLSEVK